MFSSTSFAEWKIVTLSKDEFMQNKFIFYVDFERIKKVDGYVYFWNLVDYIKPGKYGDLSEKSYNQGDCKLFRVKVLSGSFHKERTGRGTGSDGKITGKWKYPSPNSVSEILLNSVCSR